MSQKERYYTCRSCYSIISSHIAIDYHSGKISNSYRGKQNKRVSLPHREKKEKHRSRAKEGKRRKPRGRIKLFSLQANNYNNSISSYSKRFLYFPFQFTETLIQSHSCLGQGENTYTEERRILII